MPEEQPTPGFKVNPKMKKMIMWIVIVWAIALFIVVVLVWTSPVKIVCHNGYNSNSTTCPNETQSLLGNSSIASNVLENISGNFLNAT